MGDDCGLGRNEGNGERENAMQSCDMGIIYTVPLENALHRKMKHRNW